MLELWTEAVRSIEPMIKPAHRDLWLRPIECVGIGEGRIRLRAPNRYHKEWFEDNFLPSILKDLESRARQTFSVETRAIARATIAPAPIAWELPRSHERNGFETSMRRKCCSIVS